VADLPATELFPPPERGRTYTRERTVRLGDVDVGAELRLDSMARYLQDVATDDALDAGLGNAMGWLVRRTMIRVARPARLNERVALTTYCTGSGRSWAERRTTIRGSNGSDALIEGVSLWVQIDLQSGRPSRLTDEFRTIYGEAAGDRQVSSKLSLPKPVPAAGGEPWRFRTTDVDPFDHINNAAQWVVMEDLLSRSGTARRGTGEIEFVAPAGRDVTLVVGDGGDAWLTTDGSLTTSFRWTP
jgi:acyl-ACP thioesterase